MLFNSLEFALFLPSVFILYWFVFNRSLSLQNLFLTAVSFLFYGWWDWRFLFLLIFSAGLDFWVGLQLERLKKEAHRKIFFLISCCVNLSFLGFFKYYNFFVDSFIQAFHHIGIELQSHTLHIILPVGISFYTFQSLSYTIDIYRRKIKAQQDIVSFFAFVSFFPQLVAGPIERASNLLPQFHQKRIFDVDKARDGLRQMLWGFFKKIVIADNCATYVNQVFADYSHQPASSLLIGAFYFAIQIYGDFSGYSDIAIGCARLFGFHLMRNFAYPYFSRDIAEFWRRWHISLSTWFRDYVYIPLGGSRGTKLNTIKSTLILFLLSGFWHGANWTFIVWGLLNALFFMPLLIFGKNRVHTDYIAPGRILPSGKDSLKILFTFSLTLIAWIFFRAKSLHEAFAYISGICSSSILSRPQNMGLKILIPLISLLFIVEWLQREKTHGLYMEALKNKFWRWSIYVFLIFIILIYGSFNKTEFIYFAF